MHRPPSVVFRSDHAPLSRSADAVSGGLEGAGCRCTGRVSYSRASRLARSRWSRYRRLRSAPLSRSMACPTPFDGYQLSIPKARTDTRQTRAFGSSPLPPRISVWPVQRRAAASFVPERPFGSRTGVSVAHRAQFVLNDDIDEPVDMHDVPIPSIGADVELGGTYYTVEHVVINY